MKCNFFIMEIFELRKLPDNKYKFVLYDALPDGHLEKDIDFEEYDRLYNKYNHFLLEEDENKVVFAQDFNDKSNALFYLRKKFAEEFASCFTR